MVNSASFLTEDEIGRLLKHQEFLCSRSKFGPRNYLWWCLMLFCGLRVGELVQLCWEYCWLETKPLAWLLLPGAITKSGLDRRVPVPKIVKDCLIQFADVYIDHHGIFSPTSFLFPSAKDSTRHISTRLVQLVLSDLSEFVLGRKIHPHTLRHTFATRTRQVTDLVTLQSLLGHSSVRSTQVYTHVTLEDMSAAFKKLDTLNQKF